MSNLRNLRKQVAELRAQMRVGSIVATMPDGSTVTFPAKGDTVVRLVLRAFNKLGSHPPEPAPRLDEAIGLILQAEAVRWPDPDEGDVTATLRKLRDMAADAAG